MSTEHCCNCTDRGKLKYSKTYLGATLSTIPATQTGLDSERVVLECIIGVTVSELQHRILQGNMITRRSLRDASKHQEL